MSKFKIGDRVRKKGNKYLGYFGIGEELIVVGFTKEPKYAYVARQGEEEVKDSAYDSDLELIQSAKPETITLTRYIKPATIEINGVEYLMPEKNNAA